MPEMKTKESMENLTIYGKVPTKSQHIVVKMLFFSKK